MSEDLTELSERARASLRQHLSEPARAALRELAISGPGIPGPHEAEELVMAGLAVRVVQLTALGRAFAGEQDGLAKERG